MIILTLLALLAHYSLTGIGARTPVTASGSPSIACVIDNDIHIDPPSSSSNPRVRSWWMMDGFNIHLPRHPGHVMSSHPSPCYPWPVD